jgi:MFS family permease
MLAISIPASFYADTWGRRTSALLGGIVLSGCMLLIGSLYAAEAVHAYGVARWVVIVSIFVFALTYSLTWNIVAKIYASEIQPAQTRATANSIATGFCFVCVPYIALMALVIL